MGTTIATGVNTAGLAQRREERVIVIKDKPRVAAGWSRAWKRFLDDFAKAMLMTDPMAYGWYMVWTRESERRTES